LIFEGLDCGLISLERGGRFNTLDRPTPGGRWALAVALPVKAEATSTWRICPTRSRSLIEVAGPGRLAAGHGWRL
jgi:hypothetical protein